MALSPSMTISWSSTRTIRTGPAMGFTLGPGDVGEAQHGHQDGYPNPPNGGGRPGVTWATLLSMSVTCVERTFWWDAGRPADAAVEQLRAVVFDLDGALADVERDGQRLAFNAAFAAHGLDISWTVEEYGRLVRIGDEQRRIASALRSAGFRPGEHGDRRPRLPDQERSVREGRARRRRHGARRPRRSGEQPVLRGGLGRRGQHGLPDVGRAVGPAADRRRHRRDGRDARRPAHPGREPDLHGHALWELGLGPESALAVAGTPAGSARHVRRSWPRWCSPRPTAWAPTSPVRWRCARATTGCCPPAAS